MLPLCPGCDAPTRRAELDPLTRIVLYRFGCGTAVGVTEDVLSGISTDELQEVLDGHWQGNEDDHGRARRGPGARVGPGDRAGPCALGSRARPAPDAIEPLRAWRLWALHSHGAPREDAQYRLRSLTDSTVWLPGERMEARCHRNLRYAHAPVSPADLCSCGIYGGRLLGEVVAQQVRGGRLEGSGLVAGVVKLWGKVRVGPRGYRAQFGYPALLFACEAILGLEVAGVVAGLRSYRVLILDGRPAQLVDDMWSEDLEARLRAVARPVFDPAPERAVPA